MRATRFLTLGDVELNLNRAISHLRSDGLGETKIHFEDGASVTVYGSREKVRSAIEHATRQSERQDRNLLCEQLATDLIARLGQKQATQPVDHEARALLAQEWVVTCAVSLRQAYDAGRDSNH